jgi:type I restriction enzyme M protein
MAFSSLFDLHTSDLHSEAEVETRILAPLFSNLDYPPKAIIPKKQLPSLTGSFGSKKVTVEADFLLIGSNGVAKVVVEAKDPHKPVQEAWGQAASYALSYNKDKPKAERINWLLISNGHITSLYSHDSELPVVTLELSDFASGTPPYVSLKTLIKYATVMEVGSGEVPFRVITPDKLNALFAQCHHLIWKKEKLAPTDAFFEFCKFIFLKIREDKKREKSGANLQPYELPMTNAWLEAQKATSSHPIRDILFVQLRDDLENQIHTHSKKRIFEQNETLKLSADTCRELIKRFEAINLSSLDEDLNGRMFEVFLNAAVRGRDLGQYFTPRPLVDFMTRVALYNEQDIKNPPRVLDACCGTSGFLIEVMAYLLARIQNDTTVNDLEKQELKNKITNECLFGVEANERVSRIARINMYLHGDGGSHIFHGDGLDREPQTHDDMTDERKKEVKEHANKIVEQGFKLVLTNPPFSMTYSSDNTDEERILRQLVIADNSTSAKSSILFLQRYYNLLSPGGQMLIVLDDTVLNGSNMLSVRKWLLASFVLLGVHSLPFNAFFKAKANIKTSVLHVRKKKNEQDTQGHVFMSICNNIGHDNSLTDTPARNNLNDIFNIYTEWRRTGKIITTIRDNQDARENLECPEQVWLVCPENIHVSRLDSFYYAPDLLNTREQLTNLKSLGQVELKTGKDFLLRPKITPKEHAELVKTGTKLKYVEIGDVTRYGLITKYIEDTLDKLPTRGEYMIRKGDILMAINNSSRGTVVLVPPEFDGAICTSGFFVIKPKSDDEGHLLWYSLRSDMVRKQLYYLAQTASQPELKKEAWEQELVIPIPIGSDEQIAIDKSITFQNHLAALLSADSFRFGGN